MTTVTRLTEDYISSHRSIKDCLLKGLVNYSALARLISKDQQLDKKASKAAILIAARRYREKLRGKPWEDPIAKMFAQSNMEIKNNVMIYTLAKNFYPDSLLEIEKGIKKEGSLFFSIEGLRTLTIIIQRQSKPLIEAKFRPYVIAKKEDLSLITISSPGIDGVPGAVSYLTGMFFENEVNIEEFMSCHDDTLVVIESKYLDRMMRALRF